MTSPRDELYSPACCSQWDGQGVMMGTRQCFWVGTAVPLQTRAPAWWWEAPSPVPARPWWWCLPDLGFCDGFWLLGSVWEGLCMWEGRRPLFGAKR